MIVSWLIIGMLIILGLIFAKMRHIKHKTFIIALLILVTFFYVSATSILGSRNLDLTSFNGIMEAGQIYFTWLIHIGGNLGELAGHAIKMDWVGNVTGK
jgi:hypothetical protein